MTSLLDCDDKTNLSCGYTGGEVHGWVGLLANWMLHRFAAVQRQLFAHAYVIVVLQYLEKRRRIKLNTNSLNKETSDS